MKFQDDSFYSVVRSLKSSVVANILKCQAINSVDTFLHTRDVVGVLQLRSSVLDAMRSEACYLLYDNTYMVLTGISSSVEYSIELFRQKKHRTDEVFIQKETHPTYITELFDNYQS